VKTREVERGESRKAFFSYRGANGSKSPFAGALPYWQRHPRLLFTDVGLPRGLNERQLADATRETRPTYGCCTRPDTRNAAVQHGTRDVGVELMVKAFTFTALGGQDPRHAVGPARRPSRQTAI
jgi:hypothetical protein